MRSRRTRTQVDAIARVTPPSGARDHVQALYDRVIAWYEDAQRKAQLILTLDGIFLSFVASSTFTSPAEVEAMIDRFGLATWLFLALMATSLTASIVSAVVALRSRLYSRLALEKELGRRGIEPTIGDTYDPRVTWFFQHIAALDAQQLGSVLSRADTQFAVQALAENVVPLARNVVEKHRWVNRGFFFAGAVLVFFLAAAVSYVAGI